MISFPYLSCNETTTTTTQLCTNEREERSLAFLVIESHTYHYWKAICFHAREYWLKYGRCICLGFTVYERRDLWSKYTLRKWSISKELLGGDI